MISKQTQEWASDFGKEYTDRNIRTVGGLDVMYLKRYGVSRTEMNIEFMGGMDRDIRVLEVGSNIGLQLELLQKMGFRNLYGIDLSSYAVGLSKSRMQGINIIQGSALALPFKDGYFDLVFTSGVLIHINPQEIAVAMREISRCAKSLIWGFEYFAEEYTKIRYRDGQGTSELLWKANFPKIYCEELQGLSMIKMKMYGYLDGCNQDAMFLMSKGGVGC